MNPSTPRPLALIAAALCLAVAASPSGPAIAVSVGDELPTEPADQQTTFTVLGDSNTTGHATTLERGIELGRSWVVSAENQGPVLVGGYAHDGYTTTQLRERATETDADVLVIMAGTNDLRRRHWSPTDTDAVAGAIQKSRLRVGIAADDTVLLAIAPNSRRPKVTKQFNRWLKRYARAHGMRFSDPWRGMRAAGGGWARRADHTDGTHGSASAYELVGRRIATVVDRVGG